MPFVAIAVAAVATLFLSAWAWRRGSLSDRSMSIVLVAWAPMAVLGYALLTSGATLLALVAFVLVSIPGVLLYRTVLGLVAEQGSLRR